MAAATDRWIEIGSLGRAHGIRGEIYLRPQNPDTDLLERGRAFRAVADRASSRARGKHRKKGENDNSASTLVIERVRRTSQGWLVKFEGVDQREVAAALTNRKLFVRRTELPTLEPDEYYLSDLMGFEVEDQHHRKVGVITSIFDNGAHDVCGIRRDDNTEVLVPLMPESLAEIKLEAGLVRLDIPEGIPGLEDLAESDGSGS